MMASKILVVEDDMEMNELQRELLSLHGMGSVPAYSGPEEIELHKQNPADAILISDSEGRGGAGRGREIQGAGFLPVMVENNLVAKLCQ